MILPEISVTLIAGVLAGFALLIQIYYYLRFFNRIQSVVLADTKEKLPVSVIICAKNESENLQKFLPLIFEQDYPVFEVVVVNDCSYDDSNEILEEMSKRYSNLHVVTLKEDEIKAHDKKLALTLGIKGARYAHLLLTDADCAPETKHWISSMARHFNKETEIVIGYSPYSRKSGLLNRIIRYDTFYSALQYLGMASAGKPYMGVGRNLAYTKELFFRNKGFAAQYHIQSGDDDLFINKVARPGNTQVEISDNSLVYSNPKNTFKGWINQKRRHLTTSAHYKFSDKFRLGLLHFTSYLFFTSTAALFFSSLPYYIPLSVLLFRLLIQLLVFNKSMKVMKESDLLLLSPILELLLLFFYPLIAMGNISKKKHKWK